MSTDAMAALTAACDAPFPRLGQVPDRDGAVVLTSWPSVPIEIVRTAGFTPVVARGSSVATPAADAHLEADLFPSRIRHLVDAAVAGRLSRLARIVIPRTSDADYKCFLYLRELERRGVVQALAPVMLFDLLQSSGTVVREYDAARTRALLDALTAASGRTPSDDDLRLEIARSNAVRAAARRLLACRADVPRVTGADVLPLIGALWQMDPERYAALANEAASDIARRPPLAGPRVLLAGAPVDGPDLHRAIESHGVVIVAEVGPWGSGAPGQDVSCDGDPTEALADKYRADSFGPRTPGEALRRWTERALDDVDAVVVSLPPDEAVFGWDYPALRDLLGARQIPHVVLRNDPYEIVTPDDGARLDALAAAVGPHRQVRHG